MVERRLAKAKVVGSNPIARFFVFTPLESYTEYGGEAEKGRGLKPRLNQITPQSLVDFLTGFRFRIKSLSNGIYGGIAKW